MLADLAIREFVLGQDEETWVSIRNRAWQQAPDHTDETVDEFRTLERAPGFSAEGRFIAVLNRAPVGTVNAEVDPQRAEKKGFIEGPSVVPEARRRGIGRALMQKALASLTARGMATVQVSVGDWNEAGKHLAASFGFRPDRLFMRMERSLSDLPRGIGENTSVQLAALGTSDDDVTLLTRLQNESFAEHYNSRPNTVEEGRFWLTHMTELGIRSDIIAARLGKDAIGFVIYGIDIAENQQLGVNRGWVFTIGVLKSYRRRGIGRRLMLHAMAELATRGLDHVQLFVDDANITGAGELYRTLGFREVRKHVAYRRTLP